MTETGENAYELFKQLATVFYSDGPGLLVHPVWQTSNAYFVELSLTQEPRADYVSYSFTFWESSTQTDTTIRREETVTADSGGATGGGSAGRTHMVTAGETLWGIAQSYEVELTDLIARNPQIKNPNLILPGEQVKIR